MAKKKADGPNKSDAVREILAREPKTPVKDIVASLGQQGLKISHNLVYIIKSKMKQKKRREKRDRAVEVTQKAGAPNPVELIIKVRGLAMQVGGMAHLKKLVDVLAE